MCRRLCLVAVALFLVLLGVLPCIAAQEVSTVHVVSLKGEIGGGMVRYLRRAFQEAERAGADAIILEIGTLGGFVNSALDIRDMITDSPVPVHALVKGRAWSAGALIAMSCENLMMVPGSSIGAAEPRPLEAKTLSAWKAEMEATAERRGRDPRIAAAMVDSSVEIPDLVQKGEILTLGASKALEIGFINGVADSIPQVLAALELEGAQVIFAGPTPAERLAQFVTHPAVAPILLTVGFLGLILEVFTAGWGVPGTVGLVALFLYFGGALLAGVPGIWIVVVFLAGVILLFVEAVVPGFGVFGLAGITAMIISIYLASATDPQALRSLMVAVVATVLLGAVLGRYALKKGLWTRLSLPASLTTEEGYVPTAIRRDLVGREGVALTPLRPSGLANIEGERIDVVTEGGYALAGAGVRVTKVEGGRVVVRVIKNEELGGK